MAFDVIIIVVITSFIQSLFGVGVLLFGTPLMLLAGYNFIDAIVILLPISISINLVQIAKDYRFVDFELYKKILIYSIPFVIIFLFLVTQVEVNISLLVGVFIMSVAAKDYSATIKRLINISIKYEKIYLSVMGIVHGLTNLGGSLLTAIVHSKEYQKRITRVTVAIAYATFAIFQIMTLLLSGYRPEISFSGVGIYLLSGLGIFLITEKFIYMELDNEKYTKYFAIFLFLSGILLCVKSVT
jgi:hypothetical protein